MTLGLFQSILACLACAVLDTVHVPEAGGCELFALSQFVRKPWFTARQLHFQLGSVYDESVREVRRTSHTWGTKPQVMQARSVVPALYVLHTLANRAAVW